MACNADRILRTPKLAQFIGNNWSGGAVRLLCPGIGIRDIISLPKMWALDEGNMANDG